MIHPGTQPCRQPGVDGFIRYFQPPEFTVRSNLLEFLKQPELHLLTQLNSSGIILANGIKPALRPENQQTNGQKKNAQGDQESGDLSPHWFHCRMVPSMRAGDRESSSIKLDVFFP